MRKRTLLAIAFDVRYRGFVGGWLAAQRWIRLAVLSTVLAACGDPGVPAAPSIDVPVSEEPEPGAAPSVTQQPALDEPAATATNKYADCSGDRCVHGFMFERVSYILFETPSEDLDATTDDYVIVPGTFDITFVPRQDGGDPVTAGEGPDRTLYPDFELPVDLPLGFGFEEHLTMDFYLADVSGMYPRTECHVALFSSGVLSGAVVRKPGVLVCSTNNWNAPQNPGDPGLLIEYRLCGGSPTFPCVNW